MKWSNRTAQGFSQALALALALGSDASKCALKVAPDVRRQYGNGDIAKTRGRTQPLDYNYNI